MFCRRTEQYSYGYNNGSEKDDEISGAGNHFTTEFREGDTRLGVWWTPDPKIEASESPYVSMRDNPILNNDPDGDWPPVINPPIPLLSGKTIFKIAKYAELIDLIVFKGGLMTYGTNSKGGTQKNAIDPQKLKQLVGILIDLGENSVVMTMIKYIKTEPVKSPKPKTGGDGRDKALDEAKKEGQGKNELVDVGNGNKPETTKNKFCKDCERTYSPEGKTQQKDDGKTPKDTISMDEHK